MPTKNYIGEKFGYVEIIEKTDKRKNGYVIYKCKCNNCNKYKYMTINYLSRRKKQGYNNMTCGCFDKTKNNFYKNGLSSTKLYDVYNNIKSRCYNKNNKSYKDYGARGIKMCSEWLNDFEKFYSWAVKNGYSDNLTIDRIDNNGNYEPSNCKWSNKQEQVNNRRNTIKLTYNNETKPISEWAKIYNIELVTLRTRIYRGWSIEKALLEKTHLNFKGRS